MVRLIFRRTCKLRGGYDIRMFEDMETAVNYLARLENLRRLWAVRDLSRKESQIFNSKLISLMNKRGLVESK